MRKYLRYIIFIIPALVKAQSFTWPLLKPNSFLYQNHIFVYGFNTSKNDLQLKVYKANLELNKLDSVSVNLGKDNADSYLDITTDTLHNYLNFYLQKANSKNLATLIRLNDSLRLITKVENFEANKINSLTTFENEIYTYDKSTYTIRTSEDSLGKQFFLTKYTVLSDLKPFEYKLAWQYPLEKRHIQTTHVFYADNEVLFMYVNIISGEKKGQWVLKLNAGNGTVIKGVKLNPKGDTRSFLFNGYCYDKKTKHMLVAGNAYAESVINFEENKFNFTALAKQNTYFYVGIDSLCESISRHEKTVPFVFAIPKLPSKEINQYHPKLKELIKTGENEYEAYYSLYKNQASDLVFLYETGFFVTLTLNEIDVDFNAEKIYFDLSSLPNLVTKDIKDINGKLEIKSVKDFDKLLYKKPISEVERYVGHDDLKMPKWILSKTDAISSKKTFYSVSVGKKGPEHKLILENSKYDHPDIYKVKSDKLILFNTNSENTNFNLSFKIWQ